MTAPTRTPITIILAGNPYTIRPLTAGQVEQIGAAAAKSAEAPFTAAINTIGVALSRDNPTVDVRQLEVGADELTSAWTTILTLGGFQAQPSGETPAAAGNTPSTSTASPAA